MNPLLKAIIFIFGALVVLSLIFYLLGIYNIGPEE